MRHPALARVFSVVLAILSLLLLINGARGFGKNRDEHAERLAYAERFAGRIENYRLLSAELDNSADYNETMEALKTFLTKHEKAASQHKTDTAIYSATKGGLTMGENTIAVMQAKIEGLRADIKNANSRTEILSGLLSGVIASNKDRLPCLDALANTAAGYAVDCYTESAKLALVSAKLRALLENEPSPFDFSAPIYEPPAPPSMPAFSGLPALDVFSPEAAQAAYAAAASQYMSQAAAYRQASADYARQMQDYYDNLARQEWSDLNQMRDNAAEVVADLANSAEYLYAHAAWEKECVEAKGEAQFPVAATALRRLGGFLSSVVRQADALMGEAAAEAGGVYPGFEELSGRSASMAALLEGMGSFDPARLSNAEFLLLADETQELLDWLGDAYSCTASTLNDPGPLIAELMEKLHISEVLVKYLDGMLDRAQREMRAQLEELWYQFGKLEKDQIKLEAEKLGLDKEALLLSRRTLDADALKDLRNRTISARLLLVNVPEVKSGMGPDGDPTDSALAYLDTYRQRTQRLYRGKLLLNLFAVVGGAMGLLGVPGSYELVKGRFALLAPVVLCFLLAAAAEALYMALSLGQMYTALFTAIFALLHLLIIVPRAKKPRHTPKHLAV